jgi:hypothetical protein
MKHRWFGGLVLALAVALAACAPPGQGGQESSAPSQVPSSADPESAPPAESAAPSEDTGAPAPSYDYDY